MQRQPIFYVLLSASLFGISTPLAKLLVRDIPSVALAGLLYLGAFAGLFIHSFLRKLTRQNAKERHASLTKKDLPWLAGAIAAGGIIGPISLMLGLKLTSGFSASLLINLEGLATALIAIFFFKEHTGKQLWLALACMTLGGIFLSWDPGQNRFSLQGPLLIAFAMICWGLDNNLTCKISDKNPIQIAQAKGLIAGTISLFLALVLGMRVSLDQTLILALILGAFSYGLSLVLYIQALKGLGSSRTGAFFSFAPFVGAIASLVVLKDWIGWVMFPASGLMMLGAWLIWVERHSHAHFHSEVIHTHSHCHTDGHHLHKHQKKSQEPHSHEHTHYELEHIHTHWPDTHHRHEH